MIEFAERIEIRKFTGILGPWLNSFHFAGDSIRDQFSVQSGAESTEAAGAKRAALRPSGPLSAPLQESDEFGITLKIQAILSDKVCNCLCALLIVGNTGR